MRSCSDMVGLGFGMKAEDHVDEQTQAIISFSGYQVLVIG
jgi:hypothetical protein